MRFVTEARFFVDNLSNIEYDEELEEDNQYNSVFYEIDGDNMTISIILEADSEYDAINYYKSIMRDGCVINEIVYDITYGLDENLFFEQCSDIDAYEYTGDRNDFANEQGYSSTEEWLTAHGLYSNEFDF